MHPKYIKLLDWQNIYVFRLPCSSNGKESAYNTGDQSQSLSPIKSIPEQVKKKCDYTSLGLRRWRTCLEWGRPRFNPWVGKIPWRRKWQSTPVFLPGESYGWRSLVGYSPCSRKESDMTEWLHFHFQGLYNNNVSCLRTISPSWKPSG